MKQNYFNDINVIGFDADDTLWVNETFFRDAEDHFCKLLSNFETENQIHQALMATEIRNLPLYGYGVKGFVLSMMECALEISNHKLDSHIMEQVLNIGTEMLKKPVDLLNGVEQVLEYTSKKYRVLLITKGDLLDQERKLKKSGLVKYFHHVEVVSEKEAENYSELLSHLAIDPAEFLMVGNSLKSDVLPLLEIGARAVHVPYHTTWVHEQVENPTTDNYVTINELVDLLGLV